MPERFLPRPVRAGRTVIKKVTTNLATSTKGSETRSTDPLAIGEVDAHVFNCPACARPLSDGTARCPGCGTHLIMGVRLKRAAVFLGLGAVIGILLGGVTTAAVITTSPRGESAALAPVASAAPASSSAAPSPTPSLFVPDPRAPQAAVSALSGTAVVNGRIAVDAQTLSSTLARSSASTSEMARALRSLAADATLGIDLAGRLANWPEASDAQAVLDDFYRSMAQEAKTGLRASLNDGAAYRRAGREMLSVLSRLGAVDSQSRTLAATIGLELPPVVLPNLAS